MATLKGKKTLSEREVGLGNNSRDFKYDGERITSNSRLNERLESNINP